VNAWNTSLIDASTCFVISKLRSSPGIQLTPYPHGATHGVLRSLDRTAYAPRTP
jgi:hypothetical protein